MIKTITSSLPTFKPLEFESGLNILLAERHETSGARDTRNGTGKTSFIELIHFILSERTDKMDDFHKPELTGYEFEAVFREAGSSFAIKKKSGLLKDELWHNGEETSPTDLRANLAQSWFGLSSEITSAKYGPKFGALLAYFVRKERNGGFANAIQNSTSQQGWDSQVCLSYLLGFDWKLPQQLQLKKDLKKEADTLAKMIKSGFLTDGALDLKKMQTRLDLLDTEIELKRVELRSATVLDDYRAHELTANELTTNIRDLNEANLVDLDLCDSIDEAVNEIEDASIADVKNLYEQVGVFFTDQIKKRFEQVEAFHRQVSKNRELHLLKEKKSAEARIADRRKNIRDLQRSLSEKLSLLRSGIAIERLTYLQSDLNRLESEQADLQQQIPRFQNVADEKKRLQREIVDLVDLIGQDVMERDVPRKTAVQIFADTSNYLYDEPGKLLIGKSNGVGGLSIETDIVGKKSGGKNHMQVFCFDWLLVEAARKKDRYPGFLVHDSHIFDGVDGRQIALALKLAQKKCYELGVQYIVAMNSDDLQKVESELEDEGMDGFNPYDYVVPTRLTDKPDGGLFGIRF